MDKQKERIRIKDIAELSGVSVGTVDRVLHGRSGVSEKSRTKVEEILKELNYTPNMYASALASNKKYLFSCLLPMHTPGDYWTDVVSGMERAVKVYSDFNVSLEKFYYDQYESGSFSSIGKEMVDKKPDAVIMSPFNKEETCKLVDQLEAINVPYVFIDSNPKGYSPLAFYGQNARQSGYFAARIFSMLLKEEEEIVVFRQIYEGKLGSNQQALREDGFYDFMNKHCSGVKVMELNFNVKQADNFESILDDFFKNHPHIKSGITFNSKAFIIGEYLLKHNITDFKFVGYDLLRRNVACLRQNAIDFIIAQQPTLQGYNSIESLCDSLILKKEIRRCTYMPINLISVDNIDFYFDANLVAVGEGL